MNLYDQKHFKQEKRKFTVEIRNHQVEEFLKNKDRLSRSNRRIKYITLSYSSLLG